MKIVRNAKSLTDLDISFDGSARAAEVLAIPPDFSTFPKLNRFYLDELAISSDELIAFLRTCKDTLTFLWLTDIALVSGRWKDVFEFALDELSVKNIWLKSLSQDDCKVSFKAINRKLPKAKDDSGRYHEELDIAATDNEGIRPWLALLPDAYKLKDGEISDYED